MPISTQFTFQRLIHCTYYVSNYSRVFESLPFNTTCRKSRGTKRTRSRSSWAKGEWKSPSRKSARLSSSKSPAAPSSFTAASTSAGKDQVPAPSVDDDRKQNPNASTSKSTDAAGNLCHDAKKPSPIEAAIELEKMGSYFQILLLAYADEIPVETSVTVNLESLFRLAWALRQKIRAKLYRSDPIMEITFHPDDVIHWQRLNSSPIVSLYTML